MFFYTQVCPCSGRMVLALALQTCSGLLRQLEEQQARLPVQSLHTTNTSSTWHSLGPHHPGCCLAPASLSRVRRCLFQAWGLVVLGL